MNTNVAYPVLGVYLLLVLGAGMWGAVQNFFGINTRLTPDKVREHFLAGRGLGTVVWFFTMLATLFSGYSVSGIVNEAFTNGWSATRWIPGGVGLYVAFGFMAPRIHALSKRRGYFTISQVVFDRFMAPASRSNYTAHALHILTFACLQLPVFTYLITQFRSIGTEVKTFTNNGITSVTAVCVSASVLLVCDVLGGMRGVALTDMLQGIVLFIGSIIFLIIQKTELGGLPTAHDFWADPANLKITPAALAGRVSNMQFVPNKQTIVSYFDFIFKTTVAATMFPHLTARLFAAENARVIRRGMSVMVFTFFVVQLSSMITGWVAISAIRAPVGAIFGHLLKDVAEKGTGQAVLAALLLASAICAMMSTADSAMLAFSTMWVRDIYTKYLRPRASQLEQIVFGKIMGIIALMIGVGLALKVIETGKPDLSGLFAFQTCTPIHVAPAVWLGLHWRRLRGEAVLTGLVCGLSVTLGIVFSKYNIKYKRGDDGTASGLSSAWIGFCVNFGLTVTLGLAMDWWPQLFGLQPLPAEWAELDDEDELANVDHKAVDYRGTAGARPIAEGVDEQGAAGGAVPALGIPAGGATADVGVASGARTSNVFLPTDDSDSETDPTPPQHARPRPLDIGPKHDKILNPWLWGFMFLVLLFTVPFYRTPLSRDGYIDTLGKWPFTSLLLSGVLAIAGAFMFSVMWEDYVPLGFKRNDRSPVELVVSKGDVNAPNSAAAPAASGPAAIATADPAADTTPVLSLADAKP